MLFVIVGVLIIAMNLAGIGWFAAWNWELTGDLWKFCVPFGLAAIWWVWADKSGLNKRREMEKMDARRESRRRENLANLGLNYREVDKDQRKSKAFRTARQIQVDAIEGKRTKQRQKARDSLLSGMDTRASEHDAAAPDDTKR